MPTWSADSAARTYRELVAGLLHGGLTGVLMQGLRSLAGRKPAAAGARPAAPDRRRVVIVGGGFAGVAAARRFERLSVRPDSPDVTLISESNFLLFTPTLAEVAAGAVEPAHLSVLVRAAARFVLVHSGDRILPGLSAELGGYALGGLTARGIDFRLGVRVGRADAEEVRLTTGERIPTGTFVWTAGNRPDALVERVGGTTGPRCSAAGSRPSSGSPTGGLVALGHRTGAAEIRGRRFSGLAAWVLGAAATWRSCRRSEKRLRVPLDWLLDPALPARHRRHRPAPVDARPAGSPAIPAGRDR